MKPMIKVLMIVSLLSGVISCRLYDAILDNVENSLKNKEDSSESNEVGIKSFDGQKDDIKTDVKNSGRDEYKEAISLGGARESRQGERVVKGNLDDNIEAGQNIDDLKNEVVIENLKEGILNKEQGAAVVEQFSFLNEIKASEGINREANARLKEVMKISGELDKIKTKLDEMKVKIDKAGSDFNKARETSGGSDQAKRQLLPALSQAIEKAKKSRRAIENREYMDTNNTLTHAKRAFEGAVLETENVFKEVSGYALWHYYSNARELIKKAENLFKKAKESQDQLNSGMEQVEKDFNELEKIYKEFKK
ncbi:hypothetical protein [Borrelia sp. P9F1]|uniref:hypothetical protein n=1 Tax=Borrelia sp. P9F1 TaxID=3058374 RepID=UPI0026482D01|nr:hypothetical protein [Borrelia sp. P9F1]WKC58511.1 hypothetical protein QYZ68_04850 [Borrelia sp. P9F1]